MASEDNRSAVGPDMTVGFIGSGRMAQAMCKGFISSGKIKSKNIIASDRDGRMLEHIQKFGVGTTLDNTEVVQKSDVVCIAVKPHIVESVLKEVAPVVTRKNLFISIAAGIKINTLQQLLPENTRVIRVMPNTPALVQSGASVFSKGAHAQNGDGDIVAELLSSIGICEESQEYLLDAVTGLSGSGPAYAFMAIEALSDGGVKMGLPRDIAIKLAAQTLLGAAKMVLESGKHPGQLKDDVSSPNGTTIAAIHSLEKNGFRGALIDAVEAATVRSRELGQQ